MDSGSNGDSEPQFVSLRDLLGRGSRSSSDEGGHRGSGGRLGPGDISSIPFARLRRDEDPDAHQWSHFVPEFDAWFDKFADVTLVTAIPAGYSLARMPGRNAENLGIGIFLTYLVPPTLLFLRLSRVLVARTADSMWSLVVANQPSQPRSALGC